MNFFSKKIITLENFVYLMVFCLPAYLIRLNFFIFPVNLWELGAGIVFIAWIIRHRKIKNPENNYLLSDHKSLVCLLLICLGLALALLFGGNYRTGLGIIKSWFVIPFVFAFFAWEVVPREKRENIFQTYFYSAGAVSFLALIYLILGKLTYDFRLEAFFNSPNYLAMYLAPAVIIAGVREVQIKNKDNGIKIFYYLAFFIIAVALYFTYSYAAWMAIIISLLAVYFFSENISRRKSLWCFIILAGLLLLFQRENSKFSDMINFSDNSSLASRVIIWRAAGKILSDHWIFGIGPGNFQNVYLEYQKYFPPYLDWAVPHPHNIFLAFWLYSGIAGIVGFIGLIFLWFCEVLLKIREKKEPLALMAIGIMLVILIHGLFDTTYFKNDLAVVFWLNLLALKKY